VRLATSYDNRFLFTGREYAATYRSTYNNPDFNFYEYRARAYNPTLGRFMNEDPRTENGVASQGRVAQIGWADARLDGSKAKAATSCQNGFETDSRG
jgi:RHS repeat-associated protein